ncbi:hypothetical protein [Levilactobacillus enshiensis]|uniref:hypothetical protein n=1 Tax=Levilactobacillus enshiensis TaxID=2590213 RepID=UPI00117B6989|nr:hypothetical protein [Levilactobacillus enshiensis]
MVRFIGIGLILVYLTLMGGVTLLNWRSYRQSRRLVRVTGMANIFCLILAWLTVFFFRLAFVWVGPLLLLVVVGAAMLHGKALNDFHWSHHIGRLIVTTAFIVLLWL